MSLLDKDTNKSTKKNIFLLAFIVVALISADILVMTQCSNPETSTTDQASPVALEPANKDIDPHAVFIEDFGNSEWVANSGTTVSLTAEGKLVKTLPDNSSETFAFEVIEYDNTEEVIRGTWKLKDGQPCEFAINKLDPHVLSSDCLASNTAFMLN